MHRPISLQIWPLLLALILSSCAGLQSTTKEPTDAALKTADTRFIGEVTEIEQGLDGGLVELTNQRAGEVLLVVINLSNLGDESDFSFAKIKMGSILKVAGKIAQIDGKAHMAAKVAHAYTPIDIADKTATAEERQRCAAVGGEVRPSGMLGADHCLQTLPDAGEPCTSHEQCLGRCVLIPERDPPKHGSLAKGMCEADDNIFGCTALVQEGRYEGTLCID